MAEAIFIVDIAYMHPASEVIDGEVNSEVHKVTLMNTAASTTHCTICKYMVWTEGIF